MFAKYAPCVLSDVNPKIAELMQQAAKCREHAHCPYSNFRVGSAVLCKDGSIFTGAAKNVFSPVDVSNRTRQCVGRTACGLVSLAYERSSQPQKRYAKLNLSIIVPSICVKLRFNTD